MWVMVYNGGKLWYSTIYSMNYMQNYQHVAVNGCENAFMTIYGFIFST